MLGWVVPPVARWIVDLPWLPVDGPLRLLLAVPEPWLTVGAVVLVALAGLRPAEDVVADELTADVGTDDLVLARRGTARTVGRAAASAAHLDGHHLVLLDGAGAELARERTDLGVRLRDALREHGWPWTEEDP